MSKIPFELFSAGLELFQAVLQVFHRGLLCSAGGRRVLAV